MYLVSASTPRASASSLSLSSRCPLEVICPADYVICPDLRCVPSYDLCSHVVACPPSTVVCGNLLHCGLSQEDCNFYVGVSCPRHAPLRCPTGERCAFSYSQCTNTPECPDGMVRCENGVCRASAKECLLQTPCPVDRPLRCPDGSCSSITDVTCTMRPSCLPDYTLTSDNRCISKEGHGTALITSSGQCPSYMVTCPDKTCALSYHLCPVSVLCPFGLVLCQDGSCRADVSFCPSYKDTCHAPFFLCPDKTCVQHAEDCIPGIMCPEDRPFVCLQSLCVATMRDCLEFFFADALFYKFSGSSVQLSLIHI